MIQFLFHLDLKLIYYDCVTITLNLQKLNYTELIIDCITQYLFRSGICSRGTMFCEISSKGIFYVCMCVCEISSWNKFSVKYIT